MTTSKLEQKLGRLAAQAVTERSMIEDGDRILVAVSGGKDSYVMLRLLMRMRRIAPVDFELLAFHLDQAHPGFPIDRLTRELDALAVPYTVVRRDTYSIVKEKLSKTATTCSLCSRLRRGILYTHAEQLGCTKIALGHHRDDLIHTLLLNQFFTGQIKTMAPKLLSDDGRNTIIRPLAYCPESLIVAYAEEIGYAAIPCTLCSAQDELKREAVRAWVDQLAERYPRVRDSLFASLKNVRSTHLLDPRLGADTRGSGQSGPSLPAEVGEAGPGRDNGTPVSSRTKPGQPAWPLPS